MYGDVVNKSLYVLALLLLSLNQLSIIVTITNSGSIDSDTHEEFVDIDDSIIPNITVNNDLEEYRYDVESTDIKSINISSNLLNEEYWEDSSLLFNNNETIVSKPTSYGVLRVHVIASEGPLEDVYIGAYTQYCGLQWCSWNSYGFNRTDSSGVATFYLPPGIYRLDLGGKAHGNVYNVRVDAYETKDVFINVGRLILNIYDLNGNPVEKAYIDIYEQIESTNNTYLLGKHVYWTWETSVDTYVVNGTYAVKVDLDWTWSLNPVFYNIRVESSKNNTYNLQVNAVPVYFYYEAPETTYSPELDVRIYTVQSGYEFISFDVDRDGEIIYLPPDKYYYSINSIEFGWSGYIYYHRVDSFNVELGRDNEVYLLNMSKVIFRPSNYPSPEVSSVRIEFEHILYNNSEPYHTQYYGYVYMRYNESIALPPSSYYAYVEIGEEIVGKQYFNVTLGSDTILDFTLNVGFLNLTTRFQNIAITKRYDIFKLVHGGYISYSGYGYSNLLKPLPPGKYRIVITYSGYENSVVDVVIEENKVSNIDIELGKLIIHIVSPEGLEYSIPIYIIPVVNGTLIEYGELNYTYSYPCMIYDYIYEESTQYYLLPGTYAVIIPGTNTTQYYETWIYVGYGVAELNITLEPNSEFEETFMLGKIRVKIDLPKPQLNVKTPYMVGVATQKYVDGTPTIDTIIDYYSFWGLEEEFDLTPGVYVVFLMLGDNILNNTIIYNVLVEPNKTVTITYSMKYVTLNMTLLCGEPFRGMDIYIDYDGDGEPDGWLGETDDKGLLTVALLEGTYDLYWAERLGYYRTIYHYITVINVTDTDHQIIDITIYAGLVRIKAYDPLGNPIPGIEFELYKLGFYVTSITTDENGYAEAIVILDISYTLTPPIMTRDEHKFYFTVEEDEGGVIDFIFYFNVIKVSLNLNEDLFIDEYIDIIVYDRDTGSYVVEHMHITKYSYLYLLPGNYTIILPGYNTEFNDPYGYVDSYGYGQEKNITLSGNNTFTEIKFDLTYINIVFNVTLGMTSSYASLYAIDEGGEFIGKITSTYIYDEPPYAGIFLVTPGRYGLHIDGAPEGRPLRYTNISVDVDNPWILIHTPGILCVNLKSKIELDTLPNIKVYLYYWDEEDESWEYFEYESLRYKPYFTLALTSNTLYRIKATYSDRVLYEETFYLNPGEYRLIPIRLTGILIKLTGPEDEPIINALVRVYNATNNYLLEDQETNYDGEVFFILPRGEYKIVLPGLNYPSYNAYIDSNESFGYGGEYYIDFSSGEILTYNIVLARIDFRVISPSGPASGVQASLYDSTHTTPLKGGLTGENGYVRFYVTPGNYTAVIRGLNYGWYDYYELGLECYKGNGYGDYINITVSTIGVYSYTYRISELIVNITKVDGSGIPDFNVYVNSMGNDYIHGTTTDTNGLAIIYLTPGTYKVWILDREYEVTLEDYDSYTLNITLGEITIRINTPMYEKLVDEGILDMISIEIYKNYTGYGTGTRIDVFYTDEYGIVKTYLFYNETYQIVLPGFNTTHTSYGVGYGTYINVTITGDLTIVFNLSVIIAYIDGPEGPVNYIDVECRGLGTYYYMTEYTYNGYAYFVVTPGIYSMDLESIILGISEQLVNVTEYSIVWYNKTISMINIIQNNPLAGTGDISSIRVTIESLNTSESRYIYVYQSYKVYIGNGTYKLETSEYNGHVYEYIVNVGFNKTEEVVIETRNIYVYVYKPDGTLADDQYYGISLYTQEGVGENATIGYYVKGDYGKGEFEFISITPGLYVIKLRKGHDKYVYNVNVTIEEDFITKTIVLGGLIIKLYSQGEPLSNHYISLYTSSETGDINYYVTGKYTDEEGKVEFYVTSGWYALYISDVGYLYGLYVSEGEYTVYEYSIESSDLAVENISWTPEIILENMTVLFRVNITNYGPGTVYRDFNVSFYLNNTLVYIAAVYGLEANSSKIIEAPIYVAENGVCELKIVVDEINAIYDENRTNNVKTIYFTVAKKTDIISLDKPLPNSFVEETVNVEGSINPGKTVNISIYVNHTLYTILSNTRENFTVTIDLSTYPDSPIEISVLAVTIDSTEADYEEVVVYLDKTPPYLLVVEPSNNSYVPGVFNVTVIADDPYYGLPTLPIIYVNGTNYTMIKLHDKQYIYTVNATLYIDGSILNITVYVEDYSGKKTFTTIYVVIDKTPPNTSHNSTKTWYNRDVVIVLSAIDEVSGVNSTYYRIDNGEWIKGTIVYIPAPLDHSNDGLHVIEFYSIDNAGNIEEINTLLVGIDTSEPVVTSTLINNTYFVEGTLNVSITLIDQLSGLKYYAVYLDDELVINETLNGLQNYTIHLPELILDNMDEGRYEYKVIVLDIAGNIVDKTYVFYIDRTPPTVEIISPENETLASGIVEIIFNYTDNLSSVNAFLIIDGYVVNVTGKYSYSIDTREYPDGILTITLIVVDLAGNSVNVSIVLIIDNTPPYTIILHPGNNTYVSGYLTIIFNVSDDHLDQAWLYINDTAYNVINTTNIVLDTTTLPDGLYIITLYANDTLGHESYYSVVIIVDNTIPYAEIVSPKNNTCVPEIFTVKLLYSDDNLESAYLIISNTINIDVMETYSLILNTSELGLVDGEYTLKLYVRDKAGNEASYTIKIYLDTTPPIVEISSPRDHSLVNGNITVSFNYDDPHLDNATLIINGEQIEVTGTYRYILDTTSYPDGELVITLNACDLAGNCGEYTVTIIIDNTPPIINILSPRDQQVFYTNETINITWEVIEPHLSTILLYIDENEINVTNQTSYTINASQLGIGVHTIKIMAIDKLNQTNETIITINITIPAPPTTSPISPTPKPSTSPTPATTTPTKTTPAGALPGTTIAVIIIVVVIIAALVFILRKK